jgi:hypothetical protein
MNRKTFLALAMLGAMAAIGIGSASAQDKIRATIPFAFNVGSKALPAGDYELQRLNGQTMVIRELGASQAALALTMATDSKSGEGEASLVFNRYGQDSFLSEILTPDGGRVVSKSKAERRAAARAAESAENATQPRVIYVAAGLN